MLGLNWYRLMIQLGMSLCDADMTILTGTTQIIFLQKKKFWTRDHWSSSVFVFNRYYLIEVVVYPVADFFYTQCYWSNAKYN